MPVCHVRLFAATELTLSLFVCRVINTKQQADNTGSDRHKMWNCFRNGCRRVYCCKCAVRNHVKSSYIRLEQVRGRRAAKLNHRAFSLNRFAVPAFAVHSIFTAVNTFSYIFILLSNIFHVRSLLGTRKLVRFAWQYSR